MAFKEDLYAITEQNIWTHVFSLEILQGFLKFVQYSSALNVSK